jgi:hypothetical protein
MFHHRYYGVKIKEEGLESGGIGLPMTEQVDRFSAASVYQKLRQRSVLPKALKFARITSQSNHSHRARSPN